MGFSERLLLGALFVVALAVSGVGAVLVARGQRAADPSMQYRTLDTMIRRYADQARGRRAIDLGSAAR